LDTTGLSSVGLGITGLSAKDIITLIVAFAAFIISSLTYYYNVIKKADIKIVVGDLLMLNYFDEGKVNIGLNLTCFNEGARPGALVKLTGKILSLDNNKSSELYWQCFIQSMNAGERGKNFKPWVDFAGWPETIVAPGHSAVVRGIGFKTNDRFDLVKGDYKLLISGLEGSDLRELPEAECEFKIASHEEQFLRHMCVANSEGITEHMLFLFNRK